MMNKLTKNLIIAKKVSLNVKRNKFWKNSKKY